MIFTSKRKSIFKFLVLIIALSTVFSSCRSKSDARVITLAHSLPTSHPVHQGLLDFERLLDDASAGSLQVKFYPDSQLGSEREVLEMLQIGSVHMTKVSAATLSSFAPSYELLNIPFLFRDKEHMFSHLEGKIGQELLQDGAKYWLRGLCFYDAGARSFYTKKRPIRTPDDLEGLKIRVMSNQAAIDMVNSLGGSATPLAYSELYTALQQGVVDGAENNPPSFITSNHYEICKYYTIDEHSTTPDVIVISTKLWNSLSPPEQKWISEAAQASVPFQKNYWKKSVDECMRIAKEKGVEVIYPDRSLFAIKASSVLDNYKNDPVLKNYIQQIQTSYE